MHHVDVTPSAADVARPSAPRDVTVALETRAGCLRAYHRRPGRPGDLGYPVAPTVTATPGTHPRTAGRPSRAGNEIASTPTTGPREPTTAPTLSTRSIPIP